VTAVRNIPSKRSTPIIIDNSFSGNSYAGLAQKAKITTPPPGMAGVPMEAATMVSNYYNNNIKKAHFSPL